MSLTSTVFEIHPMLYSASLLQIFKYSNKDGFAITK